MAYTFLSAERRVERVLGLFLPTAIFFTLYTGKKVSLLFYLIFLRLFLNDLLQIHFFPLQIYDTKKSHRIQTFKLSYFSLRLVSKVSRFKKFNFTPAYAQPA